MSNYDFPDVYLIASNILSVIGAIINIYTLFVILVATPDYMQRYKLCLLGLQCTSTIVDVVAEMILPEIYLPLPAARVYGHLRLFWISYPHHCCAILTMSVGGVLVATSVCFIYRHRQVLPDDHWLNVKPIYWACYITCNCLPLCLMLVGIYSTRALRPNESPLFTEMLVVYPELSFLIDTIDVWMPDLASTVELGPLLVPTPWLIYSTLLFPLAVMVPFAFLFIFHAFYTLEHGVHYVSENTRRLQRKLFIALIWQTTVPLTTFAVPTSVFLFLNFTNLRIPQAAINIGTLIYTFHGKTTSILVIVLIKPYFEYAEDQFARVIKFLSFKKSTQTIRIDIGNLNSN